MRFLIILAACLLTACGTTPRLDREFGKSVRQVREQQTLDPHAIYNRSLVNGLDAQAAAAAYQSYQQSFTTKEDQSNAFSIGVGKR
ncbi:hypothetical protein KW842_15505 [Duganella sp. sic0402]|uniref:hypothetical protein n=1 Tax=Duganella sp. sic0402 TaxID=2854786 RepID=UPI001C455B33|nr:hypothetical protein [Duganella sp. sic0402]MBV7537173.1 hypothetical protein [Duganella sp. sic0402]